MICLANLVLVWVVATAVQGQTATSMLRSVFPNPTGKNGYEDYLRAADAVNDGLIGVYLDGTIEPDSPSSLRAAREQAARRLQGLDYLGRQRATVRRYGQALQLVTQGNAKPSADPRDLSAQRFPEYRVFRQLMRLASVRGYVQAADGDSGGAVQTLFDALTFSRRIAAKNNAANLSGIAGTESVMTQFAEMIGSLPLKEATSVSDYAGAALAEPSPLASAMESAGLAEDDILQKAFENPKDLVASLSETGVGARMANASPEEFRALGQALRGVVHDHYARIVKDLRSAEADWYRLSQGWPTAERVTRLSASSSMQDVADAVAGSILPTYRRTVVTELRRRAQYRLLGLHAAIRVFRWRNHRLPNRLSEVGPEFDPMSGEAFVYEIKADGGYRLYGKGRPESGPVELSYRRVDQEAPAEPR